MDESLVMQELEALFEWNPCPASLASKAMGGSHSTSTRDPLWYDLHLAPDRICRKLVHVKDLHKKIAAVVDEKLQSIREAGIELQTTAVPLFIDKATRDAKRELSEAPLKKESSVVHSYRGYTAEFCLPVASALALHPHIWKSFLVWDGAPIATGDAICDGSLQLASHLDRKTRRLDGTTKHKGPNLIDPDL